MRILSIFGTRPEAIKMAPLVRRLAREPGIEPFVCVTGQHREMLDQVLRLFGITPDVDLNVMEPGQSLNHVVQKVVGRLDSVMNELRPERVLVHGDTTTAMAGALAAFHRHIPIGHVEAGLRTYCLSRPFPEEMNRRVIDVMSDLLFAPTRGAAKNLAQEQLQGHTFVTGNTGIDALEGVASRLIKEPELYQQALKHLPRLHESKKTILVTGHRRESFGPGFLNICAALSELARRQDVQIVYPVHLNPNVRGPVEAQLSHFNNVHLIDPLEFAPFVLMMQLSYLILTDSGGVQEEAPSLGKPVLVMRDITERPEAIEAGTARLVGTNKDTIVSEVCRLLDDKTAYAAFAARPNPYGDGRASERIVAKLLGRPFEEFRRSRDFAAVPSFA